MPIVTVIIPVYNASKYLAECMESVCAQTIREMEIICINDGSTDDSLGILHEYQRKDSRIIIIDQPNKGVSAARNAGLRISTGEFIGFVDADDTISPDYYETFLKFKDSDLVSDTLTQNISLQKNKVFDLYGIQHEIFRFMLDHQDLNSACLKIFKTEIIHQHHLLFPLKMKLGEDYHFILGYLQFAETMIIIDNAGYHYRENNTSATRLVKDDKFFEKIFEEFEFDHKSVYGMNLSDVIIGDRKATGLIKSFIANLSLFFRENPFMDSKIRKDLVVKYMKKLKQTGVLENTVAIKSLNDGAFNRFVIKALQKESFLRIQGAYRYSHWRNGIK